MEVETVKALKAELKENILGLIAEFEAGTGCYVHEIKLNKRWSLQGMTPLTSDIEVVCEI